MLFNKITWFTDPHWAHPFSVIRNDKSKRNETKRDETKQKSEPHKVGGKTGRGTRQNNDAYKYTTNLQIALMFKDPRTSGSDWKGSPSSVVFYDIHVCIKHINARTKLSEKWGKTLVKTMQDETKQARLEKCPHYSSWNKSKVKHMLVNQNRYETVFFVSKFKISKQLCQVYAKTLYLILVKLKPKCWSLKWIGVPEARQHFMFQLHNIKLKTP